MRWPLQINKTSNKKVLLSIVVIVYNMQREGYRTLFSLSNSYQKGISPEDYEVIVIDNGSDQPFQFDHKDLFLNYRYFYIDNASSSPAHALNYGIKKAKGKYIGLMIDGARIVTPGLLLWATKALKLAANPVVCVPGLHLGPEHQRITVQKGYSKDVEDKLLDHIKWRDNGYELFTISCWADSSKGGWLANIAESNCIFMRQSHCTNLGGFDEAFQLPGGGCINLDFYRRACTADNVSVVYLQGEGCFHQLHGGVTTGGNQDPDLLNELHEEYRSIRGTYYTVPDVSFILYGHAPPQCISLTLDACQYILGKHVSPQVKSDDTIHAWLRTIGLNDIPT